MALLDNAVDGLVGAVLTAVPAYLLLRKGRPNRAQYEDAWKQQARELKRELATERAANDKFLADRIAALESENYHLRRRLEGGATDDQQG